MKKKFVATLAVALLALQGTAYAGTIPKVYLNNNKLFLKQSPQIENGTTYVPLRSVEALGAKVAWDNDTQTVTIQHGYNTISQRVGSDTARVNSKIVTIPAPAKKINGAVYVPIKFISEVLGANINFDKAENAIYIDYDFPTDGSLEFDSFGRIIERGKTPLNNTKEFSNYVVMGVDQSIYSHPLGYERYNWSKTPVEGQDFIRPKNMSAQSDISTDDELKYCVDLIENYLDLILNVDYRNIDSDWAHSVATLIYPYTELEYFNTILKDCMDYVNYIKDNKIIIEGDYFVEPSTAHKCVRNQFTVWVKYKGNKDFKFNETFSYNKIAGKTYEGYSSVYVSRRALGGDINDLAIVDSEVGLVGEK